MSMEKLIKRKKLQKIIKNLNRPEYTAIIGPRQAGKTTLLKILQEKLLDSPKIETDQVHYITFQDPLRLHNFQDDPVYFIKNYIQDSTQRNYFLIDEFQYAENAGSILKLLYDTLENVKIIITGSSSLEIKNISSNMVGRIFTYELRQLEYNEVIADQEVSLVKQFDETHEQIMRFLQGEKVDISDFHINYERYIKIFEQYVLYGSYPAVYTAESSEVKEEILLNIYNTYVEKDIVRLLQIGKLDSFFNLIKYLSVTIGQLFNSSSVQRELGITYKDINMFLSALEQTYVIKKIKPFYTNKVNELKKSPLIYFYDTGLRNWSTRNFNKLENRTDKGYLVENFIFNRLLVFLEEVTEFTDIKFWRKTSGTEVDFVIEKRGEKPDNIPVEVKYTHMDVPRITRSYRSFIEEYEPEVGLVITQDFLGEKKINDSRILFVPISIF